MIESGNAVPIPLHQLKDIASMVMYAAEGHDLQQVLQRIAHLTREMVGSRYAAIGVPDGIGGLRYFKISGLSDSEVALIDHPPVGKGLLGVIMNERQVLRLPRMLDDERAVGFPEGHPRMTSMLGVPVAVGSQLFGMLYLTDRLDAELFTENDQWLVETIAGYAALAIAGSQLREQGNRLSLLEERQRIAMELHDGVIQSLYAIGMYVDLLRNTGKLATENLDQVVGGLNDVIEDIRSYIVKLKIRNYYEKSLKDALRDVLSGLYVPDDIQVKIEAPDHAAPFNADDFESICFVAREVLSNALRHAQAARVMVRCWQDEQFFHLVIKDDGIGFDTTKPQTSTGLGLRNIKERIRQHHGDVKIHSEAGEGTTITIVIPLQPEQN